MSNEICENDVQIINIFDVSPQKSSSSSTDIDQKTTKIKTKNISSSVKSRNQRREKIIIKRRDFQKEDEKLREQRGIQREQRGIQREQRGIQRGQIAYDIEEIKKLTQKYKFNMVSLPEKKEKMGAVTLDEILKKRPEEKMVFFQMRYIYSKATQQIIPNTHPKICEVIGEIAANKAFYNVEYPEKVENVIKYINEKIEEIWGKK